MCSAVCTYTSAGATRKAVSSRQFLIWDPGTDTLHTSLARVRHYHRVRLVQGRHARSEWFALAPCSWTYSITYKLCVLVSNCLHGTAPRCLDVIQPVAEVAITSRRIYVNCGLHRHPLLSCQQHVVHHLETEPLRLLDHAHGTVYLSSSLTARHFSPSSNISTLIYSASL